MAIRIGGAASALAFAEAGARRALATQPTVAVEGAVNRVRATPDTRRAGWEHARGPVGDAAEGRQEPGAPEVLGGGVYIGAGGEVVIGVQDDLHFWSLDDWRTWSRLGVDDRIESINLENYAEGPRREEEPVRADPAGEASRSDGREGEAPVTSLDPGARDTVERGAVQWPRGPPFGGHDEEAERSIVGGIRQDGVGPLADYLDAPHPAKHPHWVEPPDDAKEAQAHIDIER